ncbi:hypothetical protein [Streptomyces sp. NPDC057616]|uniref:hypothetical protein n=1 Tax=Streptomyces sp. NPDC057616 TaxID=3346183 RepID=UPI00369CF172
MTDDESFDDLMAQSSLGSTGAQGLRARTSPQAARLALRIAELRQLLDAASHNDDPAALLRADALCETALADLWISRQGEDRSLVAAAEAHVRRGRLDEALDALARAKHAFKKADDWEASAHVQAAATALLIRTGRNTEALDALREMSRMLNSRTESVARPPTPTGQPRPDTAPPRPRPTSFGQLHGPVLTAHAAGGSPQWELRYGLLLAVGVQGLGGADQRTRRHAHESMLRLVNEAADVARLDPARWMTQTGEDALLALLPADVPAPTLVDTFMRQLVAGLKAVNHARGRQSWVRLGAAVHQGAVAPGANGFVGRAVIETVRILDSAPLRTALTTTPDACLAVGVSAAVFRDVVQEAAPVIQAQEFRQVQIQEKEFRRDAWIWVPGASVPHPETGPQESLSADVGTAEGSLTTTGERIVGRPPLGADVSDQTAGQ